MDRAATSEVPLSLLMPHPLPHTEPKTSLIGKKKPATAKKGVGGERQYGRVVGLGSDPTTLVDDCMTLVKVHSFSAAQL